MNKADFPNFPELPKKPSGWYVYSFSNDEAQGVVWSHWLGSGGRKAFAWMAGFIAVLFLFGCAIVASGGAVVGLPMALGGVVLAIWFVRRPRSWALLKEWHPCGVVFWTDGTLEAFTLSPAMQDTPKRIGWANIQNVEFDSSQNWGFNYKEQSKLDPFAVAGSIDVYFLLSDGSRELASRSGGGREFASTLTKALIDARMALIQRMEAAVHSRPSDAGRVGGGARPVRDFDLGE